MMSLDQAMQTDWNIGDCADLYRYTLPIFDYDRGQPSLTGTGIFVLAEGHHFVITAAHVLESRFKKIAFGFLRAEGGFQIFGADNMLILTAHAQMGDGDSQAAVYKDGLDLAVIRPTEEVLEELLSHYRCFDLRQSTDDRLPGWAVVSGWPAKKNKYNRRKRRCDFQTSYHIQWPIAEQDKVAEAGWNTDVYLALSGDKVKDFATAQTGEHIHLPSLNGVSGAGMWVRTSPTAPWSLAGVVVEDHPSKRMLKVIKVKHVWTPVRLFCQRLNMPEN
jgi:hypothetical protein